MQELLAALKKHPIIYITRDLERALGLPLNTPSYFIVSNYSEFGKKIAKANKNVLLIKEPKILDTRELLAHPKTQKFINNVKKPQILVFKNTSQIEKICAEQNWTLLNPKAELANKVEEKISQLSWLGPLKKHLPKQEVMLCKDLPSTSIETNPAPKEYIIQFNRAHTGAGTMLIVSEEPLRELKEKFPNREVRVSEFINGPAFTVNCVVSEKNVLIGNISYQITGLAPFTDSPFATIGNDWGVVNKLLSNKQVKQIRQIAIDVGKRLIKDGWRGLYGIDVIVGDKVYLIEINARQPASTTYESQLQKNNTIFEAHLASLLGLQVTSSKLREISDGAQIIQRVTHKTKNWKLEIGNWKFFNVITYENTAPGSDLLRVQSKKGIMKGHNEFNERGKIIEKLLRNY